MRAFALISVLVSGSLLVFLCLPVVRELSAAGNSYRDWFVPLAVALLMADVILLAFRLAHHHGPGHTGQR